MKRLDPQPPNLCEVGFGANNYCIINICKNVNFDAGKMGECGDLFTEIKNGVFEEEAKEGRGETFSLEHAINYLKRLEVEVPDRHVKSDRASPPERNDDVGKSGQMLANACNNERAGRIRLDSEPEAQLGGGWAVPGALVCSN